MRIKLIEPTQREFLENCRDSLNSPSIFAIMQFGIECSSSSMKNYYTMRRLLPKKLFEELCYISKIKIDTLKFEEFDENWGKIKGGKSKNHTNS